MGDHNNSITGVQMNSLTGTPMYMSPEVIKGEEFGRPGAMDIWSLGCVVLECVTGKRPWSNLDNEWYVLRFELEYIIELIFFSFHKSSGLITSFSWMLQGDHVSHWNSDQASAATRSARSLGTRDRFHPEVANTGPGDPAHDGRFVEPSMDEAFGGMSDGNERGL